MKLSLLPTSITTPTEDSWPDIVPLDTPALPQFDLKDIPSWAGDFAGALAAHTETPPELAASMVLVTCAAAAARCLRVEVSQGYTEQCNLWFVTALPSGNRKSAVQTAATEPLLDWETEQDEMLTETIVKLSGERKAGEARIKELHNKAAKSKDDNDAKRFVRQANELEMNLPTVPVRPKLWTSDATPERLGTLLAEQGECMAWLSSEGGLFDALQGRYSGGIPNLDLILKAHSGDAERVDRGHRPPVCLKHPCLTIGLSPQPDVLRGLASKPGFRGRGLLGRFLYLLPTSPLGYRTLIPQPIPSQVRERYIAGIRAMLEWVPAEKMKDDNRWHTLQLSDAAIAEYTEFARRIEVEMQPERSLAHITDWAGKASGAAIRLAGVLHAITHAHDEPWQVLISRETMQAALSIMTVIMCHSLAAFDNMGMDTSISTARVVLEWIKRQRQATFTVRDAFNGLRSTFSTVNQLHIALSILEERGYIRITETPPMGRGRPPSPQVTVRPDITEGWT